MKSVHFKTLIFMLVVMFCAPPCFAKSQADGYFYVVAYSYQDKMAYHSPIFIQKIRDCSYSDKEYCTEVALLQKIEAAFKKHIGQTTEVKLSRYTLSTRGAYKSLVIAQKQLAAELKRYTSARLNVEEAVAFILNN